MRRYMEVKKKFRYIFVKKEKNSVFIYYKFDTINFSKMENN